MAHNQPKKDVQHGDARVSSESDCDLVDAAEAFPQQSRRLTPEVALALLGEKGTMELLIDDTGFLRTKVHGESLPPAKLEFSQPKTSLYEDLLIDPDKHNPRRQIRTGDLVQLARNEILPVMIANALGITGEEVGRGVEGFDIECRNEQGGLERVQLKLLTEDSPLITLETGAARKKFLKLVALLNAPDAKAGDRVLFIQDGASNEQIVALQKRFRDAGVPDDRVCILSRGLMALHGMTLLDEQSTGCHVVFRLDLAQQSRAILASILLKSVGADGLRLLADDPGDSGDELLQILRKENIIELALLLERENRRFINEDCGESKEPYGTRAAAGTARVES